MRELIMYLLLPTTLGFFACSGKKCTSEATIEIIPRAVTVQALLADPAGYIDSLVVVSGTLVNQGKDYFKDLHCVLADSLGNTVAVTVWVPIEIPPMIDPSKPRPKVLSDYLDKMITITGYVRKGGIGQTADAFHIEVRGARVSESVDK